MKKAFRESKPIVKELESEAKYLESWHKPCSMRKRVAALLKKAAEHIKNTPEEKALDKSSS